MKPDKIINSMMEYLIEIQSYWTKSYFVTKLTEKQYNSLSKSLAEGEQYAIASYEQGQFEITPIKITETNDKFPEFMYQDLLKNELYIIDDNGDIMEKLFDIK